MKINVIGMILNNAGRRAFEGALLDDAGTPMSAADSLHTLIMEYAKVVNGGISDVATTSREVTQRRCETCKHKNVDQRQPPCLDCFGCAKWAARTERANRAPADPIPSQGTGANQ